MAVFHLLPGPRNAFALNPALLPILGKITFQANFDPAYLKYVQDQAYGIMRATLSWSASETIRLLPSLRFVLGSLDVRIWRILVWWRLILPLPVLEKRLAAPVWVFNLGIVFSISAGGSIKESAQAISEPLWEQGYPGR